MKLMELLNQWFATHKQTEFSDAVGVSQSAVSKWKNGKVPPNFENCLRMAKLMNLDPLVIFDAVEKSDFKELYKYFLPNYKPKTASLKAPSYSAEHADLHRKLQVILDAGEEYVRGIRLNLNAIHFYALNASPPPKQKHGPYRPIDDLGPGVPKSPGKKGA